MLEITVSIALGNNQTNTALFIITTSWKQSSYPGMVKHNMIHLYNGMLFGHKNDEVQKHAAK